MSVGASRGDSSSETGITLGSFSERAPQRLERGGILDISGVVVFEQGGEFVGLFKDLLEAAGHT